MIFIYRLKFTSCLTVPGFPSKKQSNLLKRPRDMSCLVVSLLFNKKNYFLIDYLNWILSSLPRLSIEFFLLITRSA